MQAEPIIFLHGLFQVPFASPVAPFLSPHSVSIPDVPAYGTNHVYHPESVSVSAAADFIHEHIHTLGDEKVHLVGHSVGGVVAVIQR